VTVSPDASVEELVRNVFLPTQCTAFPVVDGGRAPSIASFRDALAVPREARPTSRVRDIMVRADDICVDPDTPLTEALPRLATSKLRRLLVCRDGRLLGPLLVTDAMRVLEARPVPEQPTAVARSSSSASRVRTSATA
jgi:CBS domain-containing protein